MPVQGMLCRITWLGNLLLRLNLGHCSLSLRLCIRLQVSAADAPEGPNDLRFATRPSAGPDGWLGPSRIPTDRETDVPSPEVRHEPLLHLAVAAEAVQRLGGRRGREVFWMRLERGRIGLIRPLEGRVLDPFLRGSALPADLEPRVHRLTAFGAGPLAASDRCRTSLSFRGPARPARLVPGVHRRPTFRASPHRQVSFSSDDHRTIRRRKEAPRRRWM
jgi:hypothetical protein